MKQKSLFPDPRVADLIHLAEPVSDAAGSLNQSQTEWIAAARLRAKAAEAAEECQTKSQGRYVENFLHLNDDRFFRLGLGCPVCHCALDLQRTFMPDGSPTEYRLSCPSAFCDWQTPWCQSSRDAINTYKVQRALLNNDRE